MFSTYWDLALYFFIYAFFGWAVEVAIMSIINRRFCNRGFLNLPFCLSYGLIMDILILMYPQTSKYAVWQFIVAFVVVTTIEYLGGVVVKRALGRTVWKFHSKSVFGLEKKGILYSLGLTCVVLAVLYIVQPVIFIGVQFLPHVVRMVVSIVLMALVLLDCILIAIVIHNHKKAERKDAAGELEENLQKSKRTLGAHINRVIWNRFKKAYPDMEQADTTKHRFAEGMCFDKAIWILLICGVAGDFIETIYCGVVDGKWMRRSSLLYGPISLVWGAGTAIFSVVLERLADKADRYIFIAGFFMGGVFEYFTSVFLEAVFGTIFWDYSDIPFNIGGRVNLLFCMFWGIIALVWLKFCYPFLSKMIEKIPPIAGKIITWTLVFFLVFDIALTCCALYRYKDRHEGHTQANTPIEAFMDEQYPDAVIQKTWRNMKFKEDADKENAAEKAKKDTTTETTTETK